eukprot:763404-Hanusia_phi.AAC.2
MTSARRRERSEWPSRREDEIGCAAGRYQRGRIPRDRETKRGRRGREGGRDREGARDFRKRSRRRMKTRGREGEDGLGLISECSAARSSINAQIL